MSEHIQMKIFILAKINNDKHTSYIKKVHEIHDLGSNLKLLEKKLNKPLFT